MWVTWQEIVSQSACGSHGKAPSLRQHVPSGMWVAAIPKSDGGAFSGVLLPAMPRHILSLYCLLCHATSPLCCLDIICRATPLTTVYGLPRHATSTLLSRRAEERRHGCSAALDMC
jgi:hypothetical protein